ncbi:MAG: alpha/beta fold hydrolase, partial [Lysobacterales bacterium]
VKAIAEAKAAFERSDGPPQANSAPSTGERGSVSPQAREATSVGANGYAGGPGGLRERLARHHADVDGAFWLWNDVWLSPAFRRFDIRPECRRISAPLLLIQGLDDEYGTLLQLDEIARAVPHAQQLRLAACGHSPQRDQPEKNR